MIDSDMESNGFVMTRVYVHEKSHSLLCSTNYVKRINRLQHVYSMVHQPHSYSNET